MRLLLGILLLGSLFLLAATWQRGQTARLRAERSLRYGVPAAGERVDEGWSTLVLGGASGAPPLPRPEVPAPTGEEPPEEEGEAGLAAPYQPDYRYEVQPGDVLGTICKLHYGTARLKVVQAVARYNELPSPDAIRAGQVLLLPDPELLDR